MISESLEGLNVAATRQNAGSCLNVTSACAAAGPVIVAENAPAGTACANVMVVFGSDKATRLSHVAADDSDVINRTNARPKPKLRGFMVSLRAVMPSCPVIGSIHEPQRVAIAELTGTRSSASSHGCRTPVCQRAASQRRGLAETDESGKVSRLPEGLCCRQEIHHLLDGYGRCRHQIFVRRHADIVGRRLCARPHELHVFPDRQLDMAAKRRLEAGLVDFSVALRTVPIADLKQRARHEYRDVQGASRYEVSIVQVASVAAGRIAANSPQLRGRCHSHAAEEGPQGNDDTWSELRRYPLPVDR